jgi:hypothetical protein
VNKHIQKLEEADYAPASLSDAEIMNPSSVSLKNVAKRSKEEADKAAEAEVKKAKRAEMRSKYASVEDIIESGFKAGKKPSDILEDIFDIMVPGQGIADTRAGEIVRAMMRVLYRYYNDGNYFFEGYGLETAADSIAYIMDTIKDADSFIRRMIEYSYKYEDNGDNYEADLEELTDIVIHYIAKNFDELLDLNTEDSRDWPSQSLDYIIDNQPTYEYDVYGSDDVVALVENGVINAFDLKNYIESMLSYDNNFTGAEVHRPSTYDSTELTIENLTKDGYETIKDWFEGREDQFWEDLVSDYQDELDSIYNGDTADEESEDEEDIDESKSRYKQINENMLHPRNSDIILNALDNGIVKAETLLLQILKWIPEDDLDGFVEFYGYNDVDE